jgi:branched-chain amino acid aminotransferase
MNGLTPEITFDLQPSERRVPDDVRAKMLESPGFGQVFTDHMVSLSWSDDRGWHDGKLMPYGPLSLDPSTAVFHYAQEIFEGLKAYRQESGSIVAFRPYSNAARFRRSAARMAMADLPEEAFVQAIELLVAQDKEWVSADPNHSLYLRPMMIATTQGIGVRRPASDFRFLVIASPSGMFFTGGVQPVKVWVTYDYVRAAPGGTGAAKTGGNYAAGFAGNLEALAHGCDQVVWLDAIERRWVEEMGGMNLCFVFGSGPTARIVTPALTGTLLPGITRDSILTMAPDLGIPASEERISVEAWRAGCASGEITEAFACGTAAVITPVGEVRDKTGGWIIGDGKAGPVTLRLREELLGIQFGRLPDPHGWIHKIV